MPSPQAKIENSYKKRALDLTLFEAGERRKALDTLKKLEADLVNQIKVIDPTASPTASKNKKRLEKLLKKSRELISSYYAEISISQLDMLEDFADAEQAWIVSTLNNSVDVVDIASPAFTQRQLAETIKETLILGSPASAWWARQDLALQEKFADQMRIGFLSGESVTELARRVRGYPIGFGGIMRPTQAQAESLVRTSIQTISGQVRVSTIEANSDLTKGYIHDSTLDTRTTPVCRARDQLKWNNDREPVGHNFPFRVPPLHWGCRSTLLPWLKSWEELGSKIKVQIPEKTRASMNGQVPATLNYSEWLKKQSATQQKQVLGVWRYEQFKKGNLTLQAMVNPLGEPLTIKQLKERI